MLQKRQFTLLCCPSCVQADAFRPEAAAKFVDVQVSLGAVKGLDHWFEQHLQRVRALEQRYSGPGCAILVCEE